MLYMYIYLPIIFSSPSHVLVIKSLLLFHFPHAPPPYKYKYGYTYIFQAFKNGDGPELIKTEGFPLERSPSLENLSGSNNNNSGGDSNPGTPVKLISKFGKERVKSFEFGSTPLGK